MAKSLLLACLLIALTAHADRPAVFREPISQVVAMAGDTLQTCILQRSQAYCWGRNDYGGAPGLYEGFNHARQVALSGYTTCILDDDGVWCIGKGKERVPMLDHPTRLFGGNRGFCALDSQGVSCWLSDMSGSFSLPSGLTEIRAVALGVSVCALGREGIRCQGGLVESRPQLPWPADDVVDISGGLHHLCALSKQGQVACWGEADSPALLVPLGLKGVVKLVSATHSSCALDRQGKITCWGRRLDAPPQLKGGAQDLMLGASHGCARNEREIRCWGNNEVNQARLPEPLDQPWALTTGPMVSCALEATGRSRCWGNMRSEVDPAPASVGPLSSLVGGNYFLCGIEHSGALRCWGRGAPPLPTGLSAIRVAAGGDYVCWLDQQSQVGCIGHLSQPPVPKDLRGASQIFLGRFTACAEEQAGLRCWDLSSDANPGPVIQAPKGLKGVRSVAIGARHACAATATGELVCWGDQETLRDMPSLKEVTHLAAGIDHTCAWDQAQGLKCWGTNTAGECDVPPGIKDVIALDAETFHTCALDARRQVFCWGHGDDGQTLPPRLLFPK